MISSQKLWAGRGSGSSLAGEKSAWQPLPTVWLGQESWEARGSGKAVGDLCPCASPLRSVLAVLFPGEMKHNRCAENAWFSGGKVTSISFLGRGATLLLLGESCPSWGLLYPIPPAPCGPEVFHLCRWWKVAHTLLHQSVLDTACLGFPKCSTLPPPKGNPCRVAQIWGAPLPPRASGEELGQSRVSCAVGAASSFPALDSQHLVCKGLLFWHSTCRPYGGC